VLQPGAHLSCTVQVIRSYPLPATEPTPDASVHSVSVCLVSIFADSLAASDACTLVLRVKLVMDGPAVNDGEEAPVFRRTTLHHASRIRQMAGRSVSSLLTTWNKQVLVDEGSPSNIANIATPCDRGWIPS
jgi:hypothetical protein